MTMNTKGEGEQELQRILIGRLEKVVGRTLSTSADYQFMADCIAERTGEYISPTTLKRIGGYLTEDVSTRRSTLDRLSRVAGYRDFDHFQSDMGGMTAESDPARGHWLNCSDLSRGEKIELTWMPDRRCMVKYLGSERWEVIESEATRLSPGQHFRCSHIIEGEPLQILLEPSALTPKPAAYVCGKSNGVRFRKID